MDEMTNEEREGAADRAGSGANPPGAAGDGAPGRSLMEEVRRLGAAGPLALVAATMPAIGGFVLLGSLGIVGSWLREQGSTGVAIYVAGFALFAGFALLPTYAQAILGGWTFGFVVGFPAAMAGFFFASMIGYVIARRAASAKVVEVIEEKPRWRAVRDALIGSGPLRTLGIVTLLRLPPNSPFALTNLVMGSTRVAPGAYAVGTLVGMAPRTCAAVLVAAGAADLAQAQATRPKWIIVAGIVLTVAAVMVIGVIANKAIKRVTGGAAGGGPADDAVVESLGS